MTFERLHKLDIKKCFILFKRACLRLRAGESGLRQAETQRNASVWETHKSLFESATPEKPTGAARRAVRLQMLRVIKSSHLVTAEL